MGDHPAPEPNLPTDPRPLPIHLSRPAVLRLLLIVTGGSAVLLVLTALVSLTRESLRQYDWWRLLAPQASLVGERSMAVWAASLVLILVAAVCGLCYFAERHGPARTRGSWGWLVMAAGFAALSLDEVGSLHERLSATRELNFIRGSHTWAGVVALPLAAAVIALAAFAWTRLRRQPLVAGLLLLGAGLFATVPLQEEIEVAGWLERVAEAEATGAPREARPWYMAILEEGTELTAAIVFLAAGVIYLHRATAGAKAHPVFGPVQVTLEGGELVRASRVTTVLLAAGLGAAAILHILAPTPARGDPLPWFAAAMGLLAGAAAWLLPAQPGRLEARAVLSVACLFWSVDQGAVFALTDGIWAGSPRVQFGTRLVLALSTLGVAGYVAVSTGFAALRLRVLAWGGLAAIGAVSAHPVLISTLLFGAHALLLLALVDHYTATPAPASISASTTRSPAHPSHPSGRDG